MNKKKLLSILVIVSLSISLILFGCSSEDTNPPEEPNVDVEEEPNLDSEEDPNVDVEEDPNVDVEEPSGDSQEIEIEEDSEGGDDFIPTFEDEEDCDC